MKEKIEGVIFKEQRVYMLQVLWNQFFEKVRTGYPSIGNHNWSRLIEMRDESVRAFGSYEQIPKSLLEYIKKYDSAFYSIAKMASYDDLRAIKGICEIIEEGVSTDIFLDRYGKACRCLYGP
ncbi:MAG: hypothetical protein ACD_7C00169G0002 [uncultured bacterium]|nr:MAG: hypothetical protein ACD_7C00169G0002 [uncultured bacterium]